MGVISDDHNGPRFRVTKFAERVAIAVGPLSMTRTMRLSCRRVRHPSGARFMLSRSRNDAIAVTRSNRMDILRVFGRNSIAAPTAHFEGGLRKMLLGGKFISVCIS